MSIEWIFFDVGGPILDEGGYEAFWERTFREAATAEGVPCSEKRYEELAREGVRVFSRSVHEYISWRLAGADRDLHYRIHERFWKGIRAVSAEEYRRMNPPREGAQEVIRDLAGKYRLGIVANQPARVEILLREYRVWDLFQVRGISEVVGLYKPDIRLFLRTLDEARARPEESVMIGDRIDNDIVPARLIGMWAVHLRVGRHTDQQPRGPDEAPHRSIDSIKGLPSAIVDLVKLAG